jgi:hypothetical protein
MPAALIWPYEWLILGAWWAVGLVLVLRLPRVPPGPEAERQLVSASSRRGDATT